MLLKEYKEEALKELEKKGDISSERACVLLACKPTRDKAIEVGKILSIPEGVIELAVSLIKKFEKRTMISSPSKYAGASLYIASISKREKKVTQADLANVLDVTQLTIRNGMREMESVLNIVNLDAKMNDYRNLQTDQTFFCPKCKHKHFYTSKKGKKCLERNRFFNIK